MTMGNKEVCSSLLAPGQSMIGWKNKILRPPVYWRLRYALVKSSQTSKRKHGNDPDVTLELFVYVVFEKMDAPGS